MRIELNEKAKEYFNRKADDFLCDLKPDTQKRKEGAKTESSTSQIFVSAHLSENDIIDLGPVGYVDGFGQQVARYFFVDKVRIGLDGKAYASFEEFVESLCKKREINSVLSSEFIKDCAFDWFEKQYKGDISKNVKFIDFLSENAQKSIRIYKVSIPISFISIQGPFKVGNVQFEYFKKEFFDECFTYMKARAEKDPKFDENNFRIGEVKLRKRYQGAVFASMAIEAEKQKCVEIAKAETEKALMVLRFFSPTAFLPQIPCYFGIMGQSQLPKKYVFVFEDHFPEIQEGIDEHRRYTWPISNNELLEIKRLGLEKASNLITKENPSELESLLMNSMFLFGRSLTSRNYQDKMVYALVSVETLLLHNQTESIQSNIGLRLAFLTKSKAEDRKKLKDLIQEAYKIRSSYIHHGKTGKDWNLLQNLQHEIWTAMRNILISSHGFKTQKELIDYLEKLVLS